MIQETIATNLEWVVFSEEQQDDKCQRWAFDCSNEAVMRVTFNVAHCHGPKVYCLGCYEEIHVPQGCWCMCRDIALHVVKAVPIRSNG